VEFGGRCKKEGKRRRTDSVGKVPIDEDVDLIRLSFGCGGSYLLMVQMDVC
jgi:hypothetical protein